MNRLTGTDEIRGDGIAVEWAGRCSDGETLRLQMSGPNSSMDSRGSSQQPAEELDEHTETPGMLLCEYDSSRYKPFNKRIQK